MNAFSEESSTLPVPEKDRPNADFEKKKNRNRKSRKVKEHSNERYRAFNNQLFARDMEKRFDDRLGPLGVPASTVPLESIAPRPLPTPISIKLLDAMIEESVTTCVNVLKVRSDNVQADIDLVKIVTKLQIAAKVYYAQCAANVETNQRDRQFHKFVAEQFPINIESVTTYIDQIGKAIYDEQLIVPQLDSIDVSVLVSSTPLEIPPDFPEHRVTTDYIEGGDELVVGIENMDLAVAAGLVRFDNGQVTYDPQLVSDPLNRLASVPFGTVRTAMFGRNYERLVHEYGAWINRCNMRIANKIRSVNIKEGIGTVVQLVGSDVNADSFGGVDAWCIRKVSDHVMYMGAGMQLGALSTRLKDVDHSITRKRVNRAGFVSKLVETLMTRKRD